VRSVQMEKYTSLLFPGKKGLKGCGALGEWEEQGEAIHPVTYR